jgi:signal transduction histidine kinase
MKYVFAPTDLKSTFLDLVSDMKIAAEDRHLTFTSEIDGSQSFMASADGTKIKQVYLNLIDNSIKYTKEGFVKVKLVRDEEHKTIIFSVSDSGVGISPETKEKLFTKFGRGEGAVLNGGGSGLGLYLAHEIIEAHKGYIFIDSEGLGKGSTFSVTLPML